MSGDFEESGVSLVYLALEPKRVGGNIGTGDRGVAIVCRPAGNFNRGLDVDCLDPVVHENVVYVKNCCVRVVPQPHLRSLSGRDRHRNARCDRSQWRRSYVEHVSKGSRSGNGDFEPVIESLLVIPVGHGPNTDTDGSCAIGSARVEHNPPSCREGDTRETAVGRTVIRHHPLVVLRVHDEYHA